MQLKEYFHFKSEVTTIQSWKVILLKISRSMSWNHIAMAKNQHLGQWFSLNIFHLTSQIKQHIVIFFFYSQGLLTYNLWMVKVTFLKWVGWWVLVNVWNTSPPSPQPRHRTFPSPPKPPLCLLAINPLP